MDGKREEAKKENAKEVEEHQKKRERKEEEEEGKKHIEWGNWLRFMVYVHTCYVVSPFL